MNPLLLNYIPVLDKGFVARFDSSGDSSKLNQIAESYYKQLDGRFLTEISSLTLLVKCPLFVQLNMSTFGFKIKTLPADKLEVYLPNVGEIGSKSHNSNRDIAEDMVRTSAALLMNQNAYKVDGCDPFVSQLLTPISTYTHILVFGLYNQWAAYVQQNAAPAAISAYISAVDQIMKAEWK